jgi:predicted metal-dependent phosphoesterase TrpH
MNLLVNFHTHSNFSDGDQTPEAIATGLAAAGVRYAALTDHDTVESWPRFQEALKKRGLACLPGVELTTYLDLDGRELHLLGYGFDPLHPDLLATLLSLRQAREVREAGSIDGILEDVTFARKQEAAREALIERLQASLLFLHEPIANLGREALICEMNPALGSSRA